jgi:hypothetical protein
VQQQQQQQQRHENYNGVKSMNGSYSTSDLDPNTKSEV